MSPSDTFSDSFRHHSRSASVRFFGSCCRKIFPLNVRGTGTGVSALSNWGANFIVAQAFLPLVALIGRTAVFWILVGICIVAALFIYFLVPETKGRSLEQIETDLRKRVTVGS